MKIQDPTCLSSCIEKMLLCWEEPKSAPISSSFSYGLLSQVTCAQETIRLISFLFCLSLPLCNFHLLFLLLLGLRQLPFSFQILKNTLFHPSEYYIGVHTFSVSGCIKYFILYSKCHMLQSEFMNYLV